MTRRINPAPLHDPSQYGFSHVVVAPRQCQLVFIAGQLGYEDADDSTLEAEVHATFERLRTALHAAGAQPEDVVKITILVADLADEDLPVISRARRQFFGSTLPASTLIPVPRLVASEARIEIDAVASIQSE